MKTSTIQLLAFFTVILIVGGVVVVNNIVPGGLLVVTNGLGGMTVTSISSTKIYHTPTDVESGIFLVNAVADGGAEQIIGRVDQKDFQDFGYDVTNGFTINLATITPSVKYQLTQDTDKPIIKYFIDGPIDGEDCPLIKDTVYQIKVYPSIGGVVVPFTDAKYSYCVERQEIGKTGSLDKPSINFEANLAVKVDGKEQHVARICSADTCPRTADLGSFGSVTWVGNLVTGNSVSDPALYRGVYSLSAQQWTIARQVTYNDYRSSYLTAMDSLARGVVVQGVQSEQGGLVAYASKVPDKYSDAQIKSLLTTIIGPANNRADTLINENVVLFAGQKTAGTATLATLTVPSDARLINPSFVFRLKASEIGVLISSGKPSIQNAVCPKFESGSGSGIASVTVKNVGGNEGAFDAVFSGCDFRPVENIASATVGVGQTATINIPIDANTAGQMKDSCTITVYDKEDATQKDTKAVTCEATPPTCGVAGKQFIEGQCIQECKADGTTAQAFCCEQSIITNKATGKYECSSLPVATPPDTKFNKPLLIATIILALIGGGLVFGYTMPLQKIGKKYNIGLWIQIALAIGVSVGIFFLVPFVWGGIVSLFSFAT